MASKSKTVKVLTLDFETYSDENLKTCGVYRYVRSAAFCILLLAYKIDDGPTRCIDLANGEKIPAEVLKAILDPNVVKKSHNAQFEIACLSKHLGIQLDASEWECNMIKCATLSMPLGLDAVSKIVKVPMQKDYRGMALIRLFCIPNKETGERVMPPKIFDRELRPKWNSFKEYCITDVEVEHAIDKRLSVFNTFTPAERRLWKLDQEINQRGIRIDRKLVENAIAMNQEYKDSRIAEAIRLTGLSKPTSVAQLKKWLSEEMDEEVEDLKKTTIPKLLLKSPNEVVTRVLEIRQELSKSSVTKFKAMANSVCDDDRIRGLLQFCGASRTWRWAGRLVQLQNLPRNAVKSLKAAREILLKGDLQLMEMLYGVVPNILSELIRTAFIPSPNRRFLVSDFSAIEARVLAWLANEHWRLKVFRGDGKIYEASAAKMFKIAIEQITEEYRQRGKVAELAFGYGGGVNAATTMDTKKLLKEEEKQPLVDNWRFENPNIVAYWKTINDAAIKCIETGETIYTSKGVVFSLFNGIMFITLPSGRKLAYIKPRIGTNRFGSKSIIYRGQNQKTNKWEDLETYGGKLVENIVQAISRDLLGEAMIRIDDAGYTIVMHVHDEVVCDEPIGFGSVQELNELMAVLPKWADGLPMAAAGFETYYYKKE